MLLNKFLPLCFLLAMLLLNQTIFAQNETLHYSIKGNVRSSDGEPLIGATVVITDMKKGAKTDSKGNYEINNLPSNKYKVKVSYIGYNSKELTVSVAYADKVFDFWLEESAVMSKSVEVVSSRAKQRETPVAFSEMAREEIQEKLGNRDLPLALNESPGIYATQQGGTSGEGRINIRGFNQRNISVMINGVPVNDMENGWVYWSNWDGIGDVTSSVQVQRGLGASKIANPSVGGTMNIITDAAAKKAGVILKQEFGSGSMLKTSITGNSGNLNGFALSASVTRKSEDGMVDNAWTDAWSYYLGMSYDIDEKNQIDFYIIGSQQNRARRSFLVPIAAIDSNYAKELGVTSAQIAKVKTNNSYKTVNAGRLFNKHWGYLSNPGQEYYMGELHDGQFSDKLSEVTNYYNKPAMNLNWYYQASENLSLTNVFYMSIGSGGGSRGYGSSLLTDSTGLVDFETEFGVNSINYDSRYSDTKTRSLKILGNSTNNHFWVGWLSTADYKIDNNLKLQFGLDTRYYKGEHYREVRHLLGGDYYVETIRAKRVNSEGVLEEPFVDSTANMNNLSDKSKWMLKVGDKFGQNYIGYIGWIGGFLQAEYKIDDFSSYLNITTSNTSYQREDYFRTESSPNGVLTPSETFIGFTAKMGANYNLSETLNIFANLGYYNRPALFNAIFEVDNSKYENTVNEKIYAAEIGSSYGTRELNVNLNAYYTYWKDRTWTTSSYFDDGSGNVKYVYYNLAGIDALHQGVELDLNYRPMQELRIKAGISLGDWTWQNDATGSFTVDDATTTFTKKVYTDGLKVADAAQTTASFGITYYPIRGSYITSTYTYFADYYAQFSPDLRNDPNDRQQPWKAPAYGLLNLNMGYSLYDILGFDMKLKFNVFNLLDEIYVADAQDAMEGDKKHDAASARVYIGLPRNYNVGFEIKY